MPNKRALLVGIDQYPDPRNTLNSCVADTLAFRNEVLVKAYGFDPQDIHLLHNQDATIANVTAGLAALVKDTSEGDSLVFFESSHGYRYAQGDTLVEVLCLYDGFLEDTELVRLTATAPRNTLSVVLDACHSGGMDKLFLTAGGPSVARAKVFLPPPEDAAAHLGLLAQVNRFRFFGQPTVAVPGAVAYRLENPGGNKALIPPSKDFAPGGDLAGVLFAACRADQTAASGTPATNNLSAFTFGIVDQLDTTIPLQTLSDRVGARLAGLNLTQTPLVESPSASPAMAGETFVSLAPPAPAPAFDLDALREALSGAPN